MERISVIIPAYNRMDCIVKSIESVLSQSYPVGEVIVVDDCSTDQTGEVVEAMGDERVVYVRHEVNKGAGGARNTGVAHAKYDWIAFQDSDDEWCENKLETQMAYYEKHPRCGLVYSAYDILLLSGIRQVVPNEEGKNALEGWIYKDLLRKNTIGAGTVVMPKKVFLEIGGFDESMRSLEDWDFALRVAKHYEIGYVPEVLVHAYRRGASVSTETGAYYNGRCWMIGKYLEDYQSIGLFDEVVRELFEQAEQENVLEQVQKLLVHHLARTRG